MVENITYLNQQIVSHRNESFCCVQERLDKVFLNVNSFNDILDKKERIIKKAAHLLGGITFEQPYCNANKRTALSVTLYFLRKNGFNLPLLTRIDEKEVFDLLEKTMLKMEGDDTIIPEVEEYIKRKIVTIS